VWYSWIAPADGTVRVHCPSRPIAVYSGSSVSNLAVVAPVNPATFDDLVFQAAAGTEYEIPVAGAWWLPDDFTLSIVMPKAQIASPTNGAAFPLPANIEIVARTIDIDGAVVSVSFFDGTNLLTTVTNAPFQMEYPNVPAGSHRLSLQVTDENGLTTTSEPIEARVKPANDDFAQRIMLSGAAASFVADNSGATSESGESPPGGASGRTLWWTWTAPSNGIVTVTTSVFFAEGAPATPTPNAAFLQPPTGADTSPVRPKSAIIVDPGFPNPPGPTTGPLIGIYTGTALTDLSLYASNSAWFSSWFVPGEWCVLPSISFPVVRGQSYQLSFDGVNGSFGSATVAFAFAPPPVPPSAPVNDNFAQATLLSGSSLTIAGTTAAASRELGEPSHGVGPAARTVWYSWTAAASGTVQVAATASGSSALAVGVYAGSLLWNLIQLSVGSGETSFYAVAGTTYRIAVAGPDGLEAGFSLALKASPPPPTIDASHTTRLSNGSYQVRVAGVLGQSFVVQASSDSRNWVTIRTDTLLGNYLDFLDSAAAAFQQRFYRVLPLDEAFNYRPFILLAPSLQADAEFSLHLAGMPGQPFRLQTSTNLLDWSDLTGGILANERFDFTDQDAPKFPRRFYRALKQ
jgi:hypothetical protein